MSEDKFPYRRFKKTAEQWRTVFKRTVWIRYVKQADGSVIAYYRFEGAPNTTWEAELSPDVVAELGDELETKFFW